MSVFYTEQSKDWPNYEWHRSYSLVGKGDDLRISCRTLDRGPTSARLDDYGEDVEDRELSIDIFRSGKADKPEALQALEKALEESGSASSDTERGA